MIEGYAKKVSTECSFALGIRVGYCYSSIIIIKTRTNDSCPYLGLV